VFLNPYGRSRLVLVWLWFVQARGGKAIFFATALFQFSAPSHASEMDSLLTRARQLYYECVKDKKKIGPAIELFDSIGQREKSLQGRTQTYIGSLVAVKGKFAFWPHDKWKFAKSGLRIMDEGLAKS
jgi:hypothetical protein